MISANSLPTNQRIDRRAVTANSHHPLDSRNPTNSSNTTPSADDDSRATRRYAKAQCFAAKARRERRLNLGALATKEQARLEQLLAKNANGSLSEECLEELDTLLKKIDELNLVKARAAVALGKLMSEG